MSSGNSWFDVLVISLALALGVSACNKDRGGPEVTDRGTPANSAASEGVAQDAMPADDAAQPSDVVRPVEPLEPLKAVPEQDVRRNHPSPAVTESKETPAPSTPAVGTTEAEPEDVGAPLEPPAAPVEPRIIEVTVPKGSILELELLTALDTSVNRVGDEIQARTLSPLYVKGEPVLAQGSYVEGRVTAVQASGKVKGKASIGFTFDRLSTHTGVKEIRTTFVEKEAASRKKKDAGIIGGAAGAGALIGGILGGKKGAAIGAGIGGAGGTGVVLTTKGEEIRIPVGSEVNVRLDEELVLQLN